MKHVYHYHFTTVDLILNYLPDIHLVSRVATAERTRRNGHASMVLAHVVAKAKSEGVRLALDVCPDDQKDFDWIVEFYRKHGFEFVEEGEFEGLHCLCMITAPIEDASHGEEKAQQARPEEASQEE